MAEDKETTVTEEIKDIVTIEESGPCKKKVSVEIPAEKIKAALDERFGELRKDAVVPGFRKGRAPMRLLEKRFGKEVTEQIKLKLLVDASESAVKDSELDILGEPDFEHEDIELPEEGAMKFEFEDEQIDEEIETLRKRSGIWVPKEDGRVALDDQVVADVVLKVEDAAESERHDNVEIMVRKNSFVGPVPVEPLDEVLVGSAGGEKKEVSVNVAESFFNEEYRGKKIDV